jgi:hypothetical protein
MSFELEDGNIDNPFCEQHTPQKRIAMLEESTCCFDACGGVQKPHNQKHEGVNLGRQGKQLLQQEPVTVFVVLEGTRLIK